MTHLYGVIHGGWLNDIFLGHSRNIKIQPTHQLIDELAQLPKGTTVGIETLTNEDKEEVNRHLRNLPFNPPKPRFEDDSPERRPCYDEESRRYWKILEEECRQRGLNIIYLEDKEVWFKFNEAMIHIAENDAKRRNLLVLEDGESQESYNRKLVRLNHSEYRNSIAARKIH